MEMHTEGRSKRSRTARLTSFIYVILIETITYNKISSSVFAAVYVMCQVNQLVLVQQVDDIDDVHQMDPAHQADNDDEHHRQSFI